MGIYRIESTEVGVPYPGQKEYQSNNNSELIAGVYTEALIPGTPLDGYSIQEHRSSGFPRDPRDGFFIPAKLTLGPDLVSITPLDKSPSGKQLVIAVSPQSGVQVSEHQRPLNLTLSHMRKEGGLKLLIQMGRREYVCRLHPPDPISPNYNRPVENPKL